MRPWRFVERSLSLLLFSCKKHPGFFCVFFICSVLTTQLTPPVRPRVLLIFWGKNWKTGEGDAGRGVWKTTVASFFFQLPAERHHSSELWGKKDFTPSLHIPVITINYHSIIDGYLSCQCQSKLHQSNYIILPFKERWYRLSWSKNSWNQS